jgi:hypothetical protein
MNVSVLINTSVIPLYGTISGRSILSFSRPIKDSIALIQSVLSIPFTDIKSGNYVKKGSTLRMATKMEQKVKKQFRTNFLKYSLDKDLNINLKPFRFKLARV